jgi:hypothetical protein
LWLFSIILLLFIDVILYLIFHISLFSLLCNNMELITNFNCSSLGYLLCDSYFFSNSPKESVYTYIEIFYSIYLNRLEETNIISLYFESYSNNKAIEFNPYKYQMYTLINEPFLSFYNIVNRSKNSCIGYAFFDLFPRSIQIQKQQCFCMEEFVIDVNELLDLPIVMTISDTIDKENIFLIYFLILK